MKIHDLTESSGVYTTPDAIRAILPTVCLITGSYDITDTGVVNVDGNVECYPTNTIYDFKRFTVNFGTVTGHFNCSHHGLTTLDGCPTHVNRSFNCTANNLTTLHGAPIEVKGEFYCGHTGITSLVGSPSYVGEEFYCVNNEKLRSLTGLPKTIKGELWLPYAMISNNITPILSVFLCGTKGVAFVDSTGDLTDGDIQEIIRRHIKKGRAGIIPAAAELIKAGYPGFAKL